MIELRHLIAQQLAVGGQPYRKPPYFRTKKLAIIGNTANVVYAPWRDPTWTLVSHCSARNACRREPDWYFDMHGPANFTKGKRWNEQYYDWLKRLQTPIFMQEDVVPPWNTITAAVRYPIERITAEFRTTVTGDLYATNHAAYMIALAMTEGLTHIGLYGCQYASNTEYGVQRDSLSYWMGRFEQYGGRLVVPPKWNTLLSQPKELYGYASHDAEGKLTEEYRLRLTETLAPAPPGVTPTAGFVVDGKTGACERPLMQLPDGETPALDRAQRLYNDPELTHV